MAAAIQVRVASRLSAKTTKTASEKQKEKKPVFDPSREQAGFQTRQDIHSGAKSC
jgi:hypothetical protein